MLPEPAWTPGTSVLGPTEEAGTAAPVTPACLLDCSRDDGGDKTAGLLTGLPLLPASPFTDEIG